MTPMTISIITGALTTVLGALVVALCRMMVAFMRTQRETDALMRQSIMSMQKAELLRMFQRVVEDGKPISMEELEHVEACYQSYHKSGGNGTGTWLYEQIKDHAHVVTKPRTEGTD